MHYRIGRVKAKHISYGYVRLYRRKVSCSCHPNSGFLLSILLRNVRPLNENMKYYVEGNFCNASDRLSNELKWIYQSINQIKIAPNCCVYIQRSTFDLFFQNGKRKKKLLTYSGYNGMMRLFVCVCVCVCLRAPTCFSV